MKTATQEILRPNPEATNQTGFWSQRVSHRPNTQKKKVTSNYLTWKGLTSTGSTKGLLSFADIVLESSLSWCVITKTTTAAAAAPLFLAATAAALVSVAMLLLLGCQPLSQAVRMRCSKQFMASHDNRMF